MKLVDALGGVNRAIAMARHAAGIPAEEPVTVVELGKVRPSPTALIGELETERKGERSR